MHRLASIFVLLATICALLTGCSTETTVPKALVEANDLSCGLYHIEITGDNGLVLFAYQSDVLHMNGMAQWEGIATIGAFSMAFRQECFSVYSPLVQAKYWRGKWVQSTATTPANQYFLWFQQITAGNCTYSSNPVSVNTLLPLAEGEDVQVVAVHLDDATLDWDSLCDAHIDTLFGAQTFLTDATTATVTICFDAETYVLIGASFTAEYSQTKLKGTITVCASDGHAFQKFPDPEEITDGTLYEEWTRVSTEQ